VPSEQNNNNYIKYLIDLNGRSIDYEVTRYKSQDTSHKIQVTRYKSQDTCRNKHILNANKHTCTYCTVTDKRVHYSVVTTDTCLYYTYRLQPYVTVKVKCAVSG
jgi:hypothetical protein